MEKKTIKLANGSELIYKCGTAYCYLPIFYINGIVAKEWDFGKLKYALRQQTHRRANCSAVILYPNEGGMYALRYFFIQVNHT